MLPIVDELFNRWKAVFDAANAGEKTRDAVSKFNALYKKADHAEQGEYHERVLAFMLGRAET